MPDHIPTRRLTVRDIAGAKGGAPIVSLTAYTAPVARIVDAAADLVLVGDSLGMVLYGMTTTVGVTLDMMAAHGRAVVGATRRACVVVDMPFGSYQESPAQAFASAARLMAETGCAAVKLEGGQEMAETVSFLTARGVPVLGHIGLMPQSVNADGFRIQGKTEESGARIRADARAIEAAGAFGVVIENTVAPLAEALTRALAIPTIGIGASSACDGQILVTEDIVGLAGGRAPRFVKRYAALDEGLAGAVRAYAGDVRARRFPGPEHVAGPAPAQPAKRRAGSNA